jgi:hypothetical protein
VTTCLLLIEDGRHEALMHCLASLSEHVDHTFDHQVTVSDRHHRLGFAGAIREGWRRVLETDADYILHLEQDFIFTRTIPVDAMIRVLAAHPHLVQMALMRQPVNAEERLAGGVLERHGPYTSVRVGGDTWREHRYYFTTNPSIYPRRVVERGWPDGPGSEGRFGIDLYATDPDLRAAYWGDGVWVEHIGVRAGVGY